MSTLPRPNQEIINLKRKRLMEKSGTFMAILIFNVVLLLLLGGRVIYSFIAAKDDVPLVFVKVKQTTPPPPKPPAKGGAASKSLSDPTPVVVPPTVSTVSLITANTSTINFTTSDTPVPTAMLNLPTFAEPSGAGLSSGTSGGGLAQANPFGTDATSGVPGLIGELYDLKQTPDGAPTPVSIVPPEGPRISSDWDKLPATAAGLSVLRQYIKNWDQSILDGYYKSPKPLETAQIFIPTRASEEATKAFGVADKVIAKRWVIHYHGTIVPPTSGDFRFAGFGDDFLFVRVGDTNVLDGGIHREFLDLSANGPRPESIPGPYNNVPLSCGRWFKLDAGVPTTIDILIGEGPGGVSGFTLLIQDREDKSAPGDYPVFQVAPLALPKVENPTGPFSGKTLVFPAQ